MTRFLGIDYGTRRIGLAVGDDETCIASPLMTVDATGRAKQDVQAVLKNSCGYEVDAYVVGLPINMDGREGTQAKLTRAFGEELARVGDRPVHFLDERLSSRAADEKLREHNVTRGQRRNRQDALAAQIVLQEFLDVENADSDEDSPAQDA